MRYPDPPAKGPGILTASGAYVGLTNDFAEEIGLELPELEPATLEKVAAVLPAYGNYGNPLDVTAGFSADALPIAVKALLDDPNIGMLFISFPISFAAVAKAFNQGMADSPKPKVLVALGDTWQLAPDIMRAVNESPAVFSRSSDRMLRAITHYVRYGRSLGRTVSPPTRRRFRACPSSARARSRSGSARKSSPRPAFACPPASLPARRTTPSRSPRASAIRWP